GNATMEASGSLNVGTILMWSNTTPSWPPSDSVQARGNAWLLREAVQMAFAVPDADPLKASFVDTAQRGARGFAQAYVVDRPCAVFGEVQGDWPGCYMGYVGWGSLMMDYGNAVLGWAGGMSLTGVSPYAVYGHNFTKLASVGRITHG